jgi:hypothetical protein
MVGDLVAASDAAQGLGGMAAVMTSTGAAKLLLVTGHMTDSPVPCGQ